MRTITAPEVDMLLVSRSSRIQRKSITHFTPRIGLSVVDYGRLNEIDNFYNDCQNFRDYYRDPYNKLTKPEAFKKYYGKCGLPTRDQNTELLLMPTTWIRERQPVVCPIAYGRDWHFGEGIVLGGQYNTTSCTKYKR